MKAVISMKRAEGEIWTTELPEVKAGKWFFRQFPSQKQQT